MVEISNKIKKISIGYFFAAAFASMIFFYIGNYLIEYDTENVALENAQKKVLEREKVLNDFVVNGVSIVEGLYRNKIFQEYASGDVDPKVNEHYKSDLTELFLLVAKIQPSIAQLRYIDENGQEQIRINRFDKSITIVDEKHLENKADRDYFIDAKKTKIPFYSTIDLNIENAEIEHPEKATLRAVAPIYNGHFRGILVANFNMNGFLKKLVNAPLYDIVLFDRDGYTMLHYDMDKSWGNSYDHKYNIKQDHKDYELILKTNKVYRDHDHVSKIFELEYPIKKGIGMMLKMSDSYKEEINSHKAMYYSFYILTFLLAFVIPGLILKHYMGTILDYEKVKKYNEWLEYRQDELETKSFTDPLTGIGNRRRYDEKMTELIEEYQRYGKPFSMVMIDLDDFKQVNDRYNHDVGDMVLVSLVNLVKTYTRKSDTFVRFGGEEFAIFLPNTQIRNAVSFAEKLRNQISKMDLSVEGHDINITASVGVDTFESDDNKNSFFKRVDDLMYESKTTGKNKVTFNRNKFEA